MSTPPPRTFFGHPAALSSLFFTELWERFSYYGMRALLVLFLVDQVATGGMGLDDRTATAIYGLYTASVYIMSLPGGWLADRLLGGQRAVVAGGVLITAGHLLLAVPAGLTTFCAGLALIVLGTGLLKSNIAALVADLYPEGGPRRDAGFTVFYIGINLGGFFGPLVTAWLAQQYGWHAGFAAAAVGMAVGIAWFLVKRSSLGTAGRVAPMRLAALASGDTTGRGAARDLRRALGVGAPLAALLIAVAVGLLPVSAVALQAGAIYVILGLAIVYFVYLLAFAGLDGLERRRVWVLLVLFVASSVFWSGFEQGGSSLNLFAERYTDRVVGAFTIPAGWFQSLNSFFIFLLAPLFSLLWLALARRARDLSVAAKFSIGLFGMGAGFLPMVAGANIVAAGMLAAPTWLILANLIHTCAELALSPIGMSATTQLVPQRFSGQAMGLWYTTLALGNLLASRIAGDFDPTDLATMPDQFLRLFWFGAIAAALLIAAMPLLRRLAAPR